MAVATILRSGGGTDTSDANATAAQILTGYTGYVNDVLITGTMPNHGAVSISLNCGGSYTIPQGYHNGSGKVTQSLAVHWGGTYTPTTSNQTVCASGRWVTGNIICAGASTLTAGNIKKGVTIFGVKGTWQ